MLFFYAAMGLTGGASIVAERILGRFSLGPKDQRDRFSNYLIAVGQVIGIWVLLCTTVPQTAILFGTGPFTGVIAGGTVNILGIVIAWTGIIIRLQAKRRLGKFFTGRVTVFQDHQLIEDGLYRYVRHPAYLGASMFYLGLPLIVGNLVGLLVLAGLSLAAYLYRIKIEEDALVAAFGDSYRQYQQRTARLIPFVW